MTLVCELKALDTTNNLRLWLTLITLGRKIRVVVDKNESGL